MPLSRLPRFKRALSVPSLVLTERDCTIIQLIHRNRFLRSYQIVALIGASSQQILRRLQLLYHHGYLERPRVQLEYYRKSSSRHMVYGLGNKGGRLLRQELGIAIRKIPWGEKNRAVGGIFLEHALLVSDVMVALEFCCRKGNKVRLLARDDFPVSGGVSHPHPRKWSVKVNGRLKLGIIPDRVFALDLTRDDGSISRAFFFLEIDRGTMPIVRKNLSQSSFYRKLLAYEATWATGIHRSQFGFHRFRVLTVTKSAARVNSLIDACSRLRSGHGLFLFCDEATFKEHDDIFTVPWKNGRGESATLLA